MGASTETVYDRFDEHDRRLAVFDRRTRERVGLWRLADSVPTDEILERFESTAESNGPIDIPLHEPDAPTLTGRFLRYRPDDVVSCVIYRDPREGRRRLPLEDLPRSYPAWLLRFWHPDIEAPTGTDGPSIPAPAPGSTGGTSETTGRELLEEARRFVEREREAEREETRTSFAAMTPTAFVDRHGGIPRCRAAGRWHDEALGQVCGVTVVDENGEPRREVDIPSEFGIHPGNEVIVDADREGLGLPVEAEVLEIETPVLHLGVYWDSAADKTAAERAFERGGSANLVVAQLVNPTPYERRLDGIRDCEADGRKAAVLAGERNPEYADEAGLGGTAAGLNEYQRTAVERALRAEDLHVVHGPPGTGKTRAIVAGIRAAVANDERVLVVAHSNQAVDNVLVGGSTADWIDPRSVHAAVEDGELTAARAGTGTTNPVVEDRYADASIWQADLVAATTNASHRFVPDAFDRVFVDEASQSSIPATLLAFSRASRMVLAGDHRQLPPYTSDEADHEQRMAPSLMEAVIDVHGESVLSFLGRQYRMHRSIAAFPNETFYSGQLEHGERNRTWTLGDLDPIVAWDVPGQETKAPGNSRFNEREAKAAARAVETLLHRGVPPKDIGVITPYSGQVTKIAAAIRELELTGSLDRIKVDTVDAFQGSEREAIVVSFVRSNEEGRTGFLSFPEEGPRRLNVALTRARKHLVLIGDWETLASGDGGGWAYEALHEHLRRSGAFEDV